MLGPNGEWGAPSIWNANGQAVCCAPQISYVPSCTLNIATGANVIENGTTTYNGKTIRKYTVKTGANPALTLQGTVSNTGGSVGVDVWRSSANPASQCRPEEFP